MAAGKIEKFEDILGWQSGREVCQLVYQLTKTGPFSRDYGLRDQIRRAKGSAAEVRAQAYVAFWRLLC